MQCTSFEPTGGSQASDGGQIRFSPAELWPINGFVISEDERAKRRLEAAIRAGLDRCDDRLDEITAWVMTGLPSDIDLGGAFGKTPTVGTLEQRAVIVAALGDSDPMVEWRLGSLVENFHRPIAHKFGPLAGIRGLHDGHWPRDERIVEILAAAGVSEEEFLNLLLGERHLLSSDRHEELRRRPSFGRLVRDHPGMVRRLLEGDANRLAIVTRCLLDAPPDSLTGYSDTIAWLMANTSKKRRSAGADLGKHIGYPAAAPHLQQLATEGEATVRAEAIRALSRLGGDKRRSEVVLFCETFLADDRSSSVRKVVEHIMQVQEEQSALPAVQLPDFSDLQPDDGVRAEYDAVIRETYRFDEAQYARAQQTMELGASHPYYNLASTVLPPKEQPQEALDAGWRYVCEGGPLPDVLIQRRRWAFSAPSTEGSLHPLHAFRLVRVTGRDLSFGHSFSGLLENYGQTGSPSPLEFQAGADAVGFSRTDVIAALPNKLPWSEEDTWPWVAALLPEFIQVIESGVVGFLDSIDKYYDAVRTLPTMPADLRQLLLVQAVSGTKTNRPLAKAALANDENLVASVVEYLRSKKYEERSEAASWLAEMGATEVVDSLHKAAAKEKHDYAKSSILTALECFGEPIDQYLGRDRLLVDAVKGLDKKLPAAAEWIPFDSLPTLRWQDDSPVEPSIVKWLVIQAVRLKSPAPSPMVRRFFGQMVTADVEGFADTILAMWLSEDVYTISGATKAGGRGSQQSSAPREYADVAERSDRDWILALNIEKYSDEPSGSAISSKGLLSLVAAGGGSAVLAPVERYIRLWYGWRPSQCKALLEALAWVEDRDATQFLLSVGSSFRTKGIQKEAHFQAELLAERNGWTLQDLGDRTVPTGGFGEDGSQVFDYGDRQFTARLTDGLAVILSDADGKQTKALPAARQGEDEDLIKVAKKEFAYAKKIAKVAAKERPLRLHEAMCLQRRYGLDDYRRYILGHPITSRLATRLVWAATDPVGGRTLFRPLSDGTLIDEHDDEVSLAESTAIVLAHETIDGEGADGPWTQHFADYQIVPLFPQFARPQVPQMSPNQESLNACEGAIFDDRRIRSVAKKAGFQLGPGEDGGRVSAITRRFPAAGIEARIIVCGLRAVVLAQEVALEYLQFGPLDGYEVMLLAEVPEILLVETIADVNQIVAASERIDKDWEESFF